MYKAFSRTQVDLRLHEQLHSLRSLLTPGATRQSDNVPDLERAFAQYIGVKHAIAFPYCRAGMFFALKGLGFEPGSEIILPAFTFWVDAEMIRHAGYTPVFVDVDFETMSIDPDLIEAAITDKTRAIFPTHLNGLAADMDPIMSIARKHGLRVLEDCARSCGAVYKGKRVGSFDVGAFSFGYGKSIYDFGGGMVTTDDDVLAETLRSVKREFQLISTRNLTIQTLKGVLLTWLNKPLFYPLFLFRYIWKFQVEGKEAYGKRFKVRVAPYDAIPASFSVDMNNLQAWLGLSQLKRLDETNAKRRAFLQLLNGRLAGVGDLTLPPDSEDRPHVGVHYAMHTERKQALQAFLTRNRIDSQDESATDISQHEAYRQYARNEYPVAKRLDGAVLFLPTHVSLAERDILYFAEKVREFFQK